MNTPTTQNDQTKATNLQGLSGKYLTFVLAGGEYGVAVKRVREIIKVLPITPVPQTPASVKGVINLRGKVIPVVDLSLKFGLPSKPQTDQTCIIVVDVTLRGEPLPIGVIVDAVSDVTPITAAELEPPPDFGDQPGGRYITALAKGKGSVKILLDLDHVLAATHESLRQPWSPVPA